MKNIRIILLAVFAGLMLTSCYEREYIPTLGTTDVQFAKTQDTVALNSQYIYVPIQMVEQSLTGGYVDVTFLGGEVTFMDGTSRSVVEFTDEDYSRGGDILITSKQIFVGPYYSELETDTTLPTANIEIRVPRYRVMTELVLNFELSGEHLGPNTTTTMVASAALTLDITGTWVFGTTAFTVNLDMETGDYSLLTPFSSEAWGAVRDGDNLTMDVSGPEYVASTGDTVTLMMCAYDGQYLYPTEACVWSFTENEVVSENGYFIGYELGGSYYNFQGSYNTPGAVGQKR